MRLRIETFGHFAVRYGDREVALNGRKARALLGYLALAEACQETRERLVGLLWSETEEAKARASLRQTLYEIREAFERVGFDKFDADKHITKIDRDALEVDLWEVMTGAKRGEPHAILLERERAPASLLSELEAVDPSFRGWLLAKRQSLHDRLVSHLEDALRRQTDAASGHNEEQVARALMKLDPTHEEAARALIRTRVAAGDMAGALDIYKGLWTLLENEYDVEPSKETQELIAQIKLGQVAASTKARPPGPVSNALTVPTAAGETRPFIVQSGDILPFTNLRTNLVLSISPFDVSGIDSGRHYVVQGFRRELIGCLVRFREWLVCEQGPATPPATDSVNDYMVEAAASQASNAVRIVLTLRESFTNAYLWSESLNLTMENWTEAQQMVVRRIATALSVHVSAGRIASATPKSGADLLAYDLWLRGQAHFLTYEPTGWQEASSLYRKIITQHPGFAPAYSSLAQLQNTVHFVHPGIFRNEQTTQEALLYAAEATRLDPIDSRAQLCLGWANAMSGRFEQAALHHKLAHELNENDPWTLVSSALGFAFRGEPHKARPLADHALNLSLTPNGTHWRYQAMIRYMCEDYEGTIAAARQAESSIQNVFVWKAAALHSLGHTEEAKAAAEQFFNAVETRWFGGQKKPTREYMTRWFLHAFPILRREDWERLRHDFAGAGAPTEGLQHNVW